MVYMSATIVGDDTDEGEGTVKNNDAAASTACWGNSKCSNVQHTLHENASVQKQSSRKQQQVERDQHFPPQGFGISAHVLVEDDSGVSYFDDSSHLMISYSDCGPMGSATDDLEIASVQFRHFPAQADTVWTSETSSQNFHQSKSRSQLVVCLSPMEISTADSTGNSRNVRSFDAGDVILLENIHGKGQKLKSPSLQPLSILSINLASNHPLPFEYGESSNDRGRNSCVQSYDKEDISLFLPWSRRRLMLGTIGGAVASIFSSWIKVVYPPALIRIAELALVGGLSYGVFLLCESYWNKYQQRRDEKKFETFVNDVLVADRKAETDFDTDQREGSIHEKGNT